MGLKRGTVKLEKYNSNWKKEFEKEKEKLSELFGEVALSIEHIGSTSIPGLSAKPIIDIAVGVKSLADFALVEDKFINSSDYSIKEDPTEGELFVRKGPEENRTHFIHIMEIDGLRYIESILFKEYLINNPIEIKKYEELKTELAEKYSGDRIMYTDSKDKFIKNILKKAMNN